MGIGQASTEVRSDFCRFLAVTTRENKLVLSKKTKTLLIGIAHYPYSVWWIMKDNLDFEI